MTGPLRVAFIIFFGALPLFGEPTLDGSTDRATRRKQL